MIEQNKLFKKTIQNNYDMIEHQNNTEITIQKLFEITIQITIQNNSHMRGVKEEQ